MDDTSPPETPSPAPIARSRSLKYFLTELLIVTAGVLIALSVDSLRGWNRDRTLLEQARRNIGLEIAENKKDVEHGLAASDKRAKELENVLQFTNDMLTAQKSSINQLSLNAEVADLSDAAWRSAVGTGALSLLSFDEVQRYSRLYSVQELYASYQQASLRRVTAALALIAEGDPHKATAEDLRAFRHEVRALTGELFMENQLAKRLIELYNEMPR